VGPAAIAARIRVPRAAWHSPAGVCGLAFDQPGGPLVAICGLAGGAGTTTLALLLARQAAAESAAPVLLAEADPLRAGLAVLAGRATPRPLVALAQEVDDDVVPTETFVELSRGLRLIAATPQSGPSVGRDALRALLDEARNAHGLVIVDCGTQWTAESPVLAQATHIIWTLPATPIGLSCGQVQLTADVVPAPGRWREVLATTVTTHRPLVTVRALRKVARQRCDRLVLIPHSEALARGEQVISDSTTRALTGLAGTLRRDP
jgi:hypothetical protein